jgi:membrane-associated phospholipid phosphatase
VSVHASVELLTARQERGQPLFAWPGRAHMQCAFACALRGSALFAVVYGGADLAARLHTHRVSSYLPIDDAIPLVPPATLLYSSLWLMFAMVPFVLRRDHELRWLTRVIQIEIAIAGVFFLTAPMPDRLPAGDLGTFAAAFRAADAVNLEFNQFPSLHAAFGFTLAWALSATGGPALRVFLVAWSLAIAAAAVLTWQHAVLDVVGGAVLAAVVLSFVRREDLHENRR